MSVIKDNTITVEKTKENTVVIKGTLSEKLVKKHEKPALDFFSNNLSLDGFRKGNIPENIIRKTVSDVALLEEVASRALNEIYPEILKEEKLDVFGRPHVHFTKLVPGNPVEFSISTPLMPTVELADYKALAQDLNSKKEEVVLDEKDVDNALLEIRKEMDRREKQAAKDAGETPEKNSEKQENEKETEPSPLTDEKVQTISPVKTVEEFRKLVSEDLQKHKENQASEKHQLEIMEKIIDESTITIPEIVVQSELEGMMAQFSNDVMQSGVSMEDYLKQAGKTEEELIVEWRPHAEKRAKMQLILNKIASDEKLFPKKEDVDHQVKHILEANPKVEEERARVYVETQLANANVMTFLAEQK